MSEALQNLADNPAAHATAVGMIAAAWTILPTILAAFASLMAAAWYGLQMYLAIKKARAEKREHKRRKQDA